MNGFFHKIVLFFALLTLQTGLKGQELKVGETMPEIVLNDVNFKPISLKALNKDKYVFVNFYCPVNGNMSIGYYTDLLKVHKQYSNSTIGNAKGLEMYSVCFE